MFTELRDFNLPKQSDFNLPNTANSINFTEDRDFKSAVISIYRTMRIVFTEVRDFNLPKQSNFNLPDSANCIY